MTHELKNIIQSEVADFFAGFVEIHTELGGPNSIEEAQTQLTDRLCALLAAHEQEPVMEVRSHFNGEYVCRKLTKGTLKPGVKLYYNPVPVPAVSTREKLAALQLASIINDLGLPENAPFVEITSEIFRLKEMESTVPAVPDELRNRLKAEGLAELRKDASEYAPLTAKQWETLAKNWHETFIGLADRYAELEAGRAAMLNGGKS